MIIFSVKNHPMKEKSVVSAVGKVIDL